MAAPFHTRHDGPFRLQVTRARGQKFPVAEFLPATYTGEAAEAEAILLVNASDVISVSVWTVGGDRQHVMTYRPGVAPPSAAPATKPATAKAAAPIKPVAPAPSKAAREMVAKIGASLDSANLSPAQKAWVTRRAKASAG